MPTSPSQADPPPPLFGPQHLHVVIAIYVAVVTLVIALPALAMQPRRARVHLMDQEARHGAPVARVTSGALPPRVHPMRER